ncbi:MAG: UDP-N-acetylglucosamine 1-carboxyvinyltransferase [Oscillospiraceae bacterium]|nr:UDP-N-acetylglucosamine 1-carboxyvinyltransferase [Oscillospiraceae bacterium]
MEKFVIQGGCSLKGEVTISGAKNAVLPILAATVLAKDVCIIENVPEINDVGVSFRILSELGAKITPIRRNTIEIDTRHINSVSVPYELARLMRSSYYYMGSLLSRFGRSRVSMPGGCDFGTRPIDFHLRAFETLGANVALENGIVELTADHLVGAQIFFDTTSVGATINTMLAAVSAEGVTIIENAAKEPHIVDLANFMNSMGADIRGAGTDVIKIHGVQELHGTTYSIIPDQIEAGTFMVAAAATHGEVLIRNVIPKHLEAITSRLIKVGARVTEFDDAVLVQGPEVLEACTFKTMPHPGFPTDMQPQMTALLTMAQGTSRVTEGIFDHRFKYVDELRRMGANIQVSGRTATVVGVERLSGAPVHACDLRAGVAMMIAALMADGVSEIEDIHYIERGYDDIERKFSDLGANIRKVMVPGGMLENVG